MKGIDMNHKIINVGIAGFGMSGEIFQAPFLHANSNFAIKKIFERNSERSKKEYPCKTSADCECP